jgi:hypothetical protein
MKKNLRETVATEGTRVAGGTGALADVLTPELELRRSVLACMLWEDIAYETGLSVADHIGKLVAKVDPATARSVAIEARTAQKLRHVPLLMAREMARTPTHKHLVASTLKEVIRRPDELTEFLALYWKDGRCPISNQVKKGLGASLGRFDEYQLAKYKGTKANSIKLRDVLFLTHPKPRDAEQAALWAKLANNTLATPDTWEVALSSGKDKKAEWTRLLEDNKLGAMALLRNLRNMQSAGVDARLISKGLQNCNPEKVLPFRFIAAFREAPDFRAELEQLMLSCLASQSKIKGKTVCIVDVSGSMMAGISGKSRMTRVDAAAALAILVKGVSEDCVVYATAGNDCTRVASTKRVGRHKEGFALADAIYDSYRHLGGGGIFLKQCTDYAAKEQGTADTLIVISDSQDCSGDDSPKHVVPFGKFNYMMDISCHRHGIAYEKFTVLNGFSEALVNYVVQEEKLLTEATNK